MTAMLETSRLHPRARRVGLIVGLALASAAAPARAEPPATRFKLGAEDGCFRYVGDAVTFTGRLKAGSYVGVAMNTLGPTGLPVAAEEEPRSVGTELPEVPNPTPYPWFGPVPTGGEYSFMVVPRSEWGRAAIVTICGRMEPPA